MLHPFKLAMPWKSLPHLPTWKTPTPPIRILPSNAGSFVKLSLTTSVRRWEKFLLCSCYTVHPSTHKYMTSLCNTPVSISWPSVCLPLTTPTVPNLIESKSERMNGLFLFLSPSSVPCTKRTLNIYWMNVTKFLLKCIIHQNNRS